MDRDHYLPAAYLGRFSTVASGARRDRPIYIIDRDDTAVRRTTPEGIAWLPDFYTLKNEAANPRRIDNTWTAYERHLMDALDALARRGDGDMDGKLWLRVLVPFAAGLFVRGPDFGARHHTRLPPLDNLDQDDNDNRVRLVEQARLLAPLMAAEWALFTYPGPTDLITSDRGYGYIWHKDYGQGFAIPINTRQALVLLPNRQRVILHAVKNKWRAPVGKWWPSDAAAHKLNRSIAGSALTTVIGATPASVERYSADFAGQADLLTEPFGPSWPASRVRRVHEWDWLRAVHILGSRPADNETVPDHLFEMDIDRFSKGWMPELLLAIYSPDGMVRGLTRDGDSVGLSLIEEGELPTWPSKARWGNRASSRARVKEARAGERASRRANRKR